MVDVTFCEYSALFCARISRHVCRNQYRKSSEDAMIMNTLANKVNPGNYVVRVRIAVFR